MSFNAIGGCFNDKLSKVALEKGSQGKDSLRSSDSEFGYAAIEIFSCRFDSEKADSSAN